MARAAWGIDIGDTSLKAVKLERTGKQIHLLDLQVIRYSDLRTRPGSPLKDFHGEAAAVLRGKLQKRDRCVVSLPTRSVFSRFLVLPHVEKRDIPEVIAYESRQQIPFMLEEVVWAYHVFGEEHEPDAEIEVALFAVKKDVIESFLEGIGAIRKQIVRLPLGPVALYNFVCHEGPPTKRYVALDVGGGSTDFVMVDGARFWMRTIPIGGSHFTEVLEKGFKLTKDKAEKVKRLIEKSRHRARLLQEIRPVAESLATECQHSLGYYKALTGHSRIHEVVLYGFGSRLWGLSDFLSGQLGCAVRTVSQAQGIVCEDPGNLPKQFRRHLPGLGPALGMAIQGLDCATVDLDLSPGK